MVAAAAAAAIAAREPDWDDLRYFLHAARAGTLAGAARSMRVRHTTIGRRLTALERTLGAPLFLRGPEGLALTPLGERLLPLVHEVEQGVVRVRELAAAQQSRVRVALPSGFLGLLADDLARLRRAHPELTLETVIGARPADLRHGDADLALRIGPIADEELVARPLADVGWSLYAAHGYLRSHPAPADPDDLRGHELIGLGADLAATPAAHWIDAHAAGATIVLRGNDMATLLDAARCGAGLALLPCFLADDDPALARLTSRVLATRALSLVYRREQRLAEPARIVAAFLVEAMRGCAVRLAGARADPPA